MAAPAATRCMVHNPGYDFNDANLPVGAAYWALLTERSRTSVLGFELVQELFRR
jgi:metal-dependent amidase/aminoacylase/carboxypeptidase family protein